VVFFWAFIAFNTITSLLDAAFIFPQCTPVEFNWNKGIPGHCWSDEAINAIGIAQGCMLPFDPPYCTSLDADRVPLAIAAATDFTLSLLPTLFLWKIQISRTIKLGVCGIMALGFA
jgi:hypothetical protein